MANPVKIIGLGITYAGIGAVFAMSVIGCISFDLVLLYFAMQSRNRDSFLSNFILITFCWRLMLGGRNSFYENIGFSLLASPIITAISIGLAFALGVPEIAVALLIGWGATIALLTLGMAIYSIGNLIESALTRPPRPAVVNFIEENPRAQIAHAARLDDSHNPSSLPSQQNMAAEAPPPYEEKGFRSSDKGAGERWTDERHYASPIAAPAPLVASAPPAPAVNHSEDDFLVAPPAYGAT